MFGYIYKTTNLITNKIYVGKHKSSVFDTNYLGSGIHLVNSINYYGKENFITEILEQCDSLKELNESEKKWIGLLDAKNPMKGYNIANGGDGGDIFSTLSAERKKEASKKLSEYTKNLWKDGILKVHKQSDEERKKKSEHMKGKNKYPRTQETKDKISLLGKLGICGMLGKKHSQETKDKISKSRLGIPPYSKGKISITKDYVNFRYVDSIKDIPEGWVRASNTSGKICITNGKINKYIFKGTTLPEGFYIGSVLKNKLKITDGVKEKLINKTDKIPEGWYIGSKRKEKYIFITNGKVEQIILSEETIPQGFYRGRLDYKWITNGIENKKISKSEDIPEGWRQGLSQKGED